MLPRAHGRARIAGRHRRGWRPRWRRRGRGRRPSSQAAGQGPSHVCLDLLSQVVELDACVGALRRGRRRRRDAARPHCRHGAAAAGRAACFVEAEAHEFAGPLLAPRRAARILPRDPRSWPLPQTGGLPACRKCWWGRRRRSRPRRLAGGLLTGTEEAAAAQGRAIALVVLLIVRTADQEGAAQRHLKAPRLRPEGLRQGGPKAAPEALQDATSLLRWPLPLGTFSGRQRRRPFVFKPSRGCLCRRRLWRHRQRRRRRSRRRSETAAASWCSFGVGVLRGWRISKNLVPPPLLHRSQDFRILHLAKNSCQQQAPLHAVFLLLLTHPPPTRGGDAGAVPARPVQGLVERVDGLAQARWQVGRARKALSSLHLFLHRRHACITKARPLLQPSQPSAATRRRPGSRGGSKARRCRARGAVRPRIHEHAVRQLRVRHHQRRRGTAGRRRPRWRLLRGRRRDGADRGWPRRRRDRRPGGRPR